MSKDIFFAPPYKVLEVNDIQSLGQTIPWSLTDLDIPFTWAESLGEDITILLIDSGIQLDHEDLVNNINSELSCSFHPTEKTVWDKNSHGTASAGVIVATANEVGIIGVAPRARVIAVKVLGESGGGPMNAIDAGLQYAVDISSKIDIVNLSLGSWEPLSSKAYENIKILVSRGIPVVAAAGNFSNRGVMYPAKYPEVFAIAAYAFNSNESIAEFSAIGPEIDFAAPGTNITTTYLGNKYAIVSGTSFAAPFVSGIIALLMSSLKKQNIQLTVAEIKQRLIDNCIDAGIPLFDNNFGYGIINVKELILKEDHGKIIIKSKPSRLQSLWKKIKRLW